ncbi:PD-(D/E)XK nuclease family protein [Thermodesulforhabdus norvegica]|uniref:DUF3782 domain-containing protein n=1 Tax=Thermodesulforhabdus norvegica TaxID=39841 RepID=A0A1I4SJ19_9BACT|nr:DUF3782 domain-containing protein [Thermodesulforhabdus norvegica]SFM64273.1 hypothetical protein SAMN05660836_00983 [Thermodesulforhabdus norvegica]
MNNEQVKQIIMQELPRIIEKDPEVQELILRLSGRHFADKKETESRFDRLLEELRRDREEQSRRWEEQSRRWEENQRVLREMKEESERRWEEYKRELRELKEESDRRWEENQRAFRELKEESDRRWEENQRALRELKEESERRWEEYKRELREFKEESERRWEEYKRELRELKEESDRRWEENQRALRELKEESDRRWEEYKRELRELKEESERRWEEYKRALRELKEESDRRWEENQQVIRQILKRLEASDRRFESTIGALGARWGLYTEQSFRNALKGILEEFFNVEVISVTEYDDTGEVFGRPEQVELDLIIKDGILIIGEIKSSMSKADMYLFERKARFYEKRHNRKARKLIVISPMVDKKAKEVAERLGIEVYSFAEDAGAAIAGSQGSE